MGGGVRVGDVYCLFSDLFVCINTCVIQEILNKISLFILDHVMMKNIIERVLMNGSSANSEVGVRHFGVILGVSLCLPLFFCFCFVCFFFKRQLFSE